MAIDIERLVAEIDADPAKAIAQLEAFKRAQQDASRDHTSHIDVDVDEAPLRRLTTVMAGVGSGIASIVRGSGSLNQSLDATAGAAGAAGGGFRTALGGMNSFGGGIGGVIMSLAKLAFTGASIVAFLSVLPGLFASAAAAAGVLVAAIAPLVGLLGAIPVGLGAIVGGIGAAVVGFSGLGDAIGAMNKAQSESGPLMDTINQKARQEALALRALRDAQHGAAEAAEALKEAQKGLAEARYEAKEALQDQRFALRQAVLSEEAAVLRLKQAQERLRNVQKDTGDTTHDVTKEVDYFTGKVYEVTRMSANAADQAEDERAAKLELRQAELDLAMARDHTRDMQRLLNIMEKKGIKGSDQMVAARERLSDAQWAYMKALEGVKDAEYNLAEARKAQAEATTGATAAQTALNDAMSKLSPAGRDFVRFVVNEFLPAWGQVRREVQERLIPGIHRGLRNIMGAFDELGDVLGDFAGSLGDFFGDFTEFWTRPRRLNQLTSMFEGLHGVFERMLATAKPLSRVLVAITEAATPMVNTILDGLNERLDNLADWMESKSGGKAMRNFFEDAAHFGGLWLDVLRPAGGIIKGIARALKPIAEDWLVSMAESLQETSDYLNSKPGQNSILGYVERQIPTLKEAWGLLKDIGELLFGTSEGGKESAFYKVLVSLRDDVLPELKEMFSEMEDSNIGADMTRGLGDLLSMINEVDWKGIGRDLHDIAEALHKMVNWIDGMTDDDGLSKVWGWLWKIGNLDLNPTPTEPGKTKGTWRGLLSDIGKMWEDHVQDPIRGWLGLEGNESWGGLWRNAKGFAQGTWRDLRDSFTNTFIDPAKKRFRSLTDDLEIDWKGFRDWIEDRVPWINFGKIKDDFWDLVEDIKDIWRGMTKWFDNHIPDINLPDLPGKDIDWGKIIPGVWTGGPVEKNKPYLVGEKGPELFSPSTSGRIMPANPTREVLQSNGEGITDAQLERVLRRVLEDAKAPVKIEQTFNEKVDPHHLSQELAWSLS